jgi:hypothetical protein
MDSTSSYSILVTRPKSAYMMWSDQIRNDMRKINPDLPMGHLTKLMGAKWGNMTPDEKQPFVNDAMGQFLPLAHFLLDELVTMNEGDRSVVTSLAIHLQKGWLPPSLSAYVNEFFKGDCQCDVELPKIEAALLKFYELKHS